MKFLQPLIATILLFGIFSQTNAQSKTKSLTAKFVITPVAGDVPNSKVSFSVNGKTTFLKKIAGEATETDKAEYARMKIPKNAVAACGAWYAGAGDYFYAVPSAKGYIVYYGWDEEGQATNTYHWKKLKEIVSK